MGLFKKTQFRQSARKRIKNFRKKSEKDSIPILDLLLSGGIGKSKSELRRLIAQGGITIEGTKLEDAEMRILRKNSFQMA